MGGLIGLPYKSEVSSLRQEFTLISEEPREFGKPGRARARVNEIEFNLGNFRVISALEPRFVRAKRNVSLHDRRDALVGADYRCAFARIDF